VSALIQKNFPYYIVFDYVLNEQVKLCLSEELMSEYREVLLRPKFAKIDNFLNNAEVVLSRFEKIATFYEPKNRLDIITDRSDNKLLELAEESNANFLITGNSIDFTMKQYKETQVLSPRIFWDIITNYH
jgi:putative PIN family toxin of toxin-antitoxin system